MKALSATLLIAAFLLSACDKTEDTEPRPPLGGDSGSLVGQDYHFKIKSEDWESYGTPGDDLFGYSGTHNVNIITDAIAQHGTVKLYVMRNFGN